MRPRYFGPQPVEYKGLVFGLEKFAHMGDELLRLAQMEWMEVGDEERFGEFKPDAFSAMRFEQNTGMLVFTVRGLGSMALLGYFICTLAGNLKKAGELVATETAVYLAPPMRKGLAADKLLGYVEKYLGGKGVARLILSHRPDSPRVGTFYQRRGYTPLCVSYSKVLHHGTHEEDEIRAAV